MKIGSAATVVLAAVVLTWKSPIAELTSRSLSEEPTPSTTRLDDPAGSGRAGRALAAIGSESADSVDVLDAQLTVAPAQPAWIEARIVDTRGDPIVGAQLVCVDRISDRDLKHEEAPLAKSGNDGRVRLPLTRADENKGRGRAVATPLDTWRVRVEATATAKTRVVREFDAREGHSVALGTLVLEDAGLVVGRVVDEFGQAVSAAVPVLYLPDVSLADREKLSTWGPRGKRPLADASSAVDGKYSFSAVKTGFYRVWVRAHGHFGALSEPFEVRAGETTRLPDLTTRTNDRVIRGIVLGVDGNPTAAEVDYTLPNNSGGLSWTSATVSKDGRFLIEGITTATVDIHAEREPLRNGGDGVAIVRGVAAGSQDIVIRMHLHPTLEILVQDERGTPIDAYEFMIVDLDGSGQGTKIETPGPTRLRVPAKPFMLEISKAGFVPATLGPFDSERLPERQVVALRASGRIAGRVFADGAPAADVEVCLTRVVQDHTRAINGFLPRLQSCGIPSSKSLADGSFELELRESGSYVVMARKSSFAIFESAILELEPKRGISGLEITLTRGGSVTGRVVDFDPKTSTDRFVIASRGTDWNSGAPIEDDGTYTIEHLTPGDWALRTRDEEFNSLGRFTTCGPPDPRNRTAVILNGGRAHLDLVEATPAPIEFAGRFVVESANMRTWSAATKAVGADDSWWQESALQGDGKFKLTWEGRERRELRWRSAGTDLRSDSVEFEFDLEAAPPSFDMQIATGSISNAIAPADIVEITATLTNGARWTTQIRTPSGRSFHIDGLPVGDVTLRQGSQTLAKAHVAAGVDTAFEWNGAVR